MQKSRVLPLVDGRMIGSELMGGRAKLQALQADFHLQVGQRFGLTRQTTQARPSATIRKRAIDSAFDVLKAHSGLSDAVLLALLVPHVNDPAPLLLELGLEMPTPTNIQGEFAKIMTKPCKPEKPIGFGKKKSIGFDESAAPAKPQTLCSVGFGKTAPSLPPPNETPADIEDGEVRERESDQRADDWDEIRGEHIKRSPATSIKPLVTAAVQVALKELRERPTISERHAAIEHAI